MVQLPCLVNGSSFVYGDEAGDIDNSGLEKIYGVYSRDTRYVHEYVVLVGGQKLSGTTLALDAQGARYSYQIFRMSAERLRTLYHDRLLDKFLFENKSNRAVPISLRIRFDVDFKDIFEVRGIGVRHPTGAMMSSRMNGGFVFRQKGLDGRSRQCRIAVQLRGRTIDLEGFQLMIESGKSASFIVQIQFGEGVLPRAREQRPSAPRRGLKDWLSTCIRLKCGNEKVQSLLDRASSDIYSLLVNPQKQDFMVNGGAPSFVCPFGRDSIIVSLQTLVLYPGIAKSVLRFLAAHQGRKIDARTEEEPGRILHEYRFGQLANAGLIPFAPYYGSIDATLLFVWLYAETMLWTDDKVLARELYPKAKTALDWARQFGDVDGDGLVEYRAGWIRNQVWKDSGDSTFHRDGSLAEPPVAALEVQGYLHAAKLRMADASEWLGDPSIAKVLRDEADLLKGLIQERFWSDSLGFFGLALDRQKRLCEIITSNPGHLLWTNAVSNEKARQVVEKLIGPSLLWTGYGMKTLAWGEPRHDPRAYHNGSVWPHDTAIAAKGMTDYGFDAEMGIVSAGVFELGAKMPFLCMPELVAGLRSDEAAAPEPLGGMPQAWAAGSLYMLLTSWLGIRVDALRRHVLISARLPRDLEFLKIRGMSVGRSRLSLNLSGEGDRTRVTVVKKPADLKVEVL